MTLSDSPLQEGIRWAELCRIFDSVPVRIALIDHEHRYRYLNPLWTKFSGWSAEAALGRTIADVFGHRLSKAGYALLCSQYERGLAGETVEWHGWIEDHLGRRYVQRTFTPLRDSG